MPHQTVIWTAIPNGRTPTALRLSVVVSPRLQAAPGESPDQERTLDAFVDFLDWPRTLRENVTFQVQLGDGPPLPAQVIPPPASPPPSNLWRSLFRRSTRVVPHRFDDLTNALVFAANHPSLDQVIKGIYVSATGSALGGGTSKPKAGALAHQPPFADIRPGPPGSGGGGVTGGGGDPTVGGNGTGTDPGQDRRGGSGIVVIIGAEVEVDVPGVGSAGGSGGVDIGIGGPGGAQPGTTPGTTPGSPGQTPGETTPGQPPPAPTAPPSAAEAKVAFQQVRDIYAASSEPPRPPTADELRTLLDFHEMVALLGEHPELLHRLGLVVELEVLAGGLLGGLLAADRVRVLPSWPNPRLATTNVAPVTACVMDGGRFVAAPRPADPEVDDGLLRAQDPRYSVIQYDVDGTVLKLGNLANALHGPPTATRPADEALPSLRSAGISVVRADRASELVRAFNRAKALNDQITAATEANGVVTAGPLFAEDLIGGYRVDVWDEVTGKAGAWHSLCQRQTTYEFLDPPDATSTTGPTVTAAGEGYVEPAVTEKDEPPAPGTPPIRLEPRLVTSPAVFTWEGWSLSAPRPRLYIDPDDTIAPAPNTVETSLRLRISSTAVDRTLPRLRFGRKYRLRARSVDLAGHSRALFPAQPQTLPQATAELTYARFQPVASPAVVLAAVPTEGASLERLVVSSDPERFGTIWIESTERHLAPPKASQMLVETHGRFDKMRPQDSYALAKREAGSFKERPGRPDLPPPPGMATAQSPAASKTEGYRFFPVPKLQVPYLADPLARGVLFVGLPGTPVVSAPGGEPGRVLRVAFPGTWPNLETVRLRVVRVPQGSPAKTRVIPATAAESAVVEVPLRPAERATVRLSTFITGTDATPASLGVLHAMGVWQWIEELGDDSDRLRLQAEALLGRNWLLMPYRELELVHAVQRPVQAPTLPASLESRRETGQTFALVTTQVGVHAASTARVDLDAAWVDPVDDPSRPDSDPRRDVAPGRAALGHCDVLPDEASVAVGGQLHLGDTKHHRVHVRAIGTSRFREYFPPFEDMVQELRTPDLTRASHAKPNFAAPAAPPGTLASEAIDKQLAGAVLSVKSSARPAPPAVAYVLPTFTWDRDPESSTRRCRGVRVYLKRPWFSSGPGEMLGVVFRSGQQPNEGAPLRPFVTGWGADPAWASIPLPQPTLEPASFDTRVVSPIALEELPKPTVSVAPFPVQYDPERKLWFADVRMRLTAGYYPFLRLALARYQPESLPGVEISKVTLADFVQLPPECTTTVATLEDEGGKRRRRVTVQTTTGSHNWRKPGQARDDKTPEERATSRFELTVLRKRPGGSELDWDVEAGPEQAQILSSPDSTLSFDAIVAFGQDPAERRLVVKQIESYVLARPPVISSVSPASLTQGDEPKPNGGDNVSLNGAGFHAPVTVSFGAGVNVDGIQVFNTTSIGLRVRVDENAPETSRTVTVVTADGKRGTLPGRFKIARLPDPNLTAIDPNPLVKPRVGAPKGEEEPPLETVLKLSGENLRRKTKVAFVPFDPPPEGDTPIDASPPGPIHVLKVDPPAPDGSLTVHIKTDRASSGQYDVVVENLNTGKTTRPQFFTAGPPTGPNNPG